VTGREDREKEIAGLGKRERYWEEIEINRRGRQRGRDSCL
jgi:hypothetical protein